MDVTSLPETSTAINLVAVSALKFNDISNQTRQIESYLGVSEKPEDDLAGLVEARMTGSCEWFAERASFQTWMDPSSTMSPRILWVSANPATGKSVLTGYIINYLESLNLDCSYYFFSYGDKVKASLSGFLLSVAFQMAMSSTGIRKKILTMIEHDTRFDKGDERAIWRKLFTTAILGEADYPPHYWVVDALDECINYKAFFQMISKINHAVPIRIFITSRKTPEIKIHFDELQKQHRGQGVIFEEISAIDTHDDIALYLQANIRKLRVGNDRSRQELLQKIQAKSRGCFLWVRLVLEELEGAWSQQQIEQVLEEVPQDMDPFYARALNVMSSKPNRTKELTKRILVWTMCSVRPLTVTELQKALKLELDVDIDDLENAIASLCGQLIFVDSNKKVLMIHLTARAFLLAQDLDSEFAVDKGIGHLRLAETSLQYLNSDEMKSPRSRRSGKAFHNIRRSPFVFYASASFSEHMRLTSSNNNILEALVNIFLKTNVLSWIEHVAQTGNLYLLTRTSKNLQNYLQRQAQYRSPMGEKVQRAEAWATDLVRLVAKFGKNLVESPSSIYWLIPPFCPSSSAIASQFGISSKGLSIHGLSNTGWDDRLACIDFQDKQATALSCGGNSFAVGLSSGVFVLFHNATCQEWKRLDHGEPLKHLKYDGSGTVLGSASRKTLKIWDINSGHVLWQFVTSHDILTLVFGNSDKLLMAVSKGNAFLSWNLETGLAAEDCHWRDVFGEQQYRRPPMAAALNSDLSLLAIVYRGRPICLWDMNGQNLYGLLGREPDPGSLALGTNTSVSSLVFSPNDSLPLLAAAYEDGDLALFEPWNLKLLKVIEANAQIVTCSSDGCTLATGNSAGMVQLFEFETLQLLYRVSASDYGVRTLAFSSDDLRFLDVRGKLCNVWEPSILSGLPQHEEDSVTEALPLEPRIIGVGDGENPAEITTLALHDTGEFAFCGMSDGSVFLYETQNAAQKSILYYHTTDIPISFSIWGSKTSILVTADAASRYIVRRLVHNTSIGTWAAGDIIIDAHSHSIILQLLLSPDDDLLLVSTTKSDTVWEISSRAQIAKTTYSSRTPFKWANHPSNVKQRVLFDTSGASVWEWDAVSSLSPSSITFGFDPKTAIEPGIKSVIYFSSSEYIVIECSRLNGQRTTTDLFVIESSQIRLNAKEIQPNPMLTSIKDKVMHLIGAYGTKLVFLDRNLWVCTIEIKNGTYDFYARHFFIPSEWHSQQKKIDFRITKKGDLLFVKGNEIAVIVNGLENEELVPISFDL